VINLITALALAAAPQLDDRGPPVGEEEIFQTEETIEYTPPRAIETKKGQKCKGLSYTPTSEDKGPPATTKCIPAYPRNCFRGAVANVAVELEFDVNIDGFPTAVRVLRSTDKCFETTAARGVAAWRFPASSEPRFGVKTTTTFFLEH
jgi:outer membrane biosynthesis protein TonB